MPIWDPNSYVEEGPPSTPIWLPPGGTPPPSTTPIGTNGPPIWMPSSGAPSGTTTPFNPIWMPDGTSPSMPTEGGNPALPIWHPGRYGPPSSPDGVTGTSQDRPRSPATPITLDGRPLDETTGVGGAPPISSPLLPSIDDLESNANFAFLQTLLNRYGLGDAYDKMVGLIADDASPAEIELAIRDTDVFKERFPQIFAREEAGDTPISPADVINYERGLEQMFSLYGVPESMDDSLQQRAAEYMTDDKSLNEIERRLVAQRTFANDVLNDPNMDVAAVQALLGDGVTPYDIAEYALDPTRALAEVERRLEAASISNEASQAGYGIEAEEALALQQAGLTMEQSQAGFGSLVQQSQVVDGLNNEEDPVTREQELAALTGDVAANAAIEGARRARTSAFEVGGGFARDDDGFGGLR